MLSNKRIRESSAQNNLINKIVFVFEQDRQAYTSKLGYTCSETHIVF